MIDSGRQELRDQKFDDDVSNIVLTNKLFVRLIAKGKSFSNVNFMYGIFDGAYLRNCSFEDCNFTGCRFINCNFAGTTFRGCIFDYATFDNTQIDNDVLDMCCPDRENLKLKFARSLRINYQGLGDAKSANKAMNVEMAATEEHHKKAWASNDQYYRRKYAGLKRFGAFIEWLDFKVLDFVWGNGESLFKLARAIFLLLCLIAIVDVVKVRDVGLVSSYWNALLYSPQVFFGIDTPQYITKGWAVIIYATRLVMFAFFVSILIKRFNRR